METLKLILQFVGAVTIVCAVGMYLLYIHLTSDIQIPEKEELSDLQIDDLIN